MLFTAAINALQRQLGKEKVIVNDKPLLDGQGVWQRPQVEGVSDKHLDTWNTSCERWSLVNGYAS